MYKIVFPVLAVLLLSMGCKQNKKAVAANDTKEVKPVEVKPINPPSTVLTTATVAEEVMDDQQQVDENTINCRLMVSFTSIGEGVDGAAGEKLMQLIKQHEDAYGKPLRYDRFQRGREGEYVMCFKMLKESDEAVNNFIGKVNKAFNGNKLVFVTENGAYKK